jgi:hypothetical protein
MILLLLSIHIKCDIIHSNFKMFQADKYICNVFLTWHYTFYTQTFPTFANATCGNFSNSRTVSSPGFPCSWPLRILAAVTVDIPRPSPINKITFLATFVLSLR